MNKVSHDSETPAHGQQVITACAFIYRVIDGEPKVFLAKRAATKKFLPNVFELPGGHIDYGENLTEGLRREIEEELGMSISVGDPFAAFTYKNNIKGSHSIEVIYFAKFIGNANNITIHPEDHSTFEWFSREDVLGRKNELMSSSVELNDEEDPEYLSLLKGFDLLSGNQLDLAS